MNVILENVTAEIVEKKSRFIANVFYVENEKEAEIKLNEMRKKYYDAKHNCFAYKIFNIEKSSDDGEPSGTAGHPMLDIIKGRDLTNCIAIVTRYFGGVLLGTGGLVRAYSDSLKLAFDKATFSKINEGFEVSFSISYENLSKINNIIKNIENSKNNSSQSNMIIEISKNFGEKVDLKYIITSDFFDKFADDIKNVTNGCVILEKNQKKIYYLKGKEIKFFPN